MSSKITPEDFIKMLEDVHGKGRWDYSYVKYEGKIKNITIGCPVHGLFHQRANRHLSGKVCPTCSLKTNLNPLKKPADHFLSRFKEVHKDMYDYSLIKVIENSATKLPIICKKCEQVFMQSANTHYGGSGCPNCMQDRRIKSIIEGKAKKFINKASKKHNHKYGYNDTTYTGLLNKILITCFEHGNFEQTAKDHLGGSGCPKCGLFGYKKKDFLKKCKDGKALLYVIRCYNSDESFIKLGITSKSSTKGRYNTSLKMPYNYEVLFEKQTYAEDVYDLEKSLIRGIKQFRYNPSIKFSGMTECFTLDSLPHIQYTLTNH